MPLRELACAALGWALAIAVWIAASGLQRSLLSDPFGADGMPRGLAAALAIVSTLIAVRAFLGRAKPLPEAGEAAQPGAMVRAHAKAFGIVALGAAYVLLVPPLGYVATAALLLFATTLYYGGRASLTLAAISLAGSVFFWWMFARVLGISMPVGLWARLLA